MIKTYPELLLVAYPPQLWIDLIAQWKQMLKNEIGGFASWNSKAHITIAFCWNQSAVDHYIPRIRTFCKFAVPAEVIFDKLVYGDETFLIEPKEVSKKYINNFIRDLHKHINKKGKRPSAHISIGRELSDVYIPIAKEIFKDEEINLKFPFAGLHLLKFNSETGHYSDIIETFEFTGKQQPDLFS